MSFPRASESFSAMVQPSRAPSKPKKKKVTKHPTPKHVARDKYKKRLDEIKVLPAFYPP
jgi:hypothetical protein